MNKIGKAMLCTVLTGAMAVGAAGAADLGSLSPQGAKAYLNQITTLQNKYGKAAARTDDEAEQHGPLPQGTSDTGAAVSGGA